MKRADPDVIKTVRYLVRNFNKDQYTKLLVTIQDDISTDAQRRENLKSWSDIIKEYRAKRRTRTQAKFKNQMEKLDETED